MAKLPSVPFMGLLGFVFGCCLAVIIALLFMPANDFWPSTCEHRLFYLQDLTLNHHFAYRSNLRRFAETANGTNKNKTYETEDDFLRAKARMLCYSIEQEADDETHASLIVTTWGMHCDRTIMFYTSPRLISKIHPKYIGVVNLVYIDPANSTIGTLLSVLKEYVSTYQWFTYVPPKVFLLPNNLKYYLLSSKIDPKTVAFSGKPDTDKLFGTWSVSESSPLAISNGAIRYALNSSTSSCASQNIEDPGCLVSLTQSTILDIRDSEGHRVIEEIKYGDFWIQYGNVDAKNSLKGQFPASVHVVGSYTKFIDLEYYLHHLKPYGIQSVIGGYTKELRK